MCHSGHTDCPYAVGPEVLVCSAKYILPQPPNLWQVAEVLVKRCCLDHRVSQTGAAISLKSSCLWPDHSGMLDARQIYQIYKYIYI